MWPDPEPADGFHRGRGRLQVVKDSVITTKIKTKLAGENLASLAQIKVDTDNAGVVWLTGTAPSQADADKVIAIAKGTEGVTAVNSEIVIKPEK
jgi:hyperosmotically inducible protein